MIEKLKGLPLKKILPIALILIIVVVLVVVLFSCNRNEDIHLTNEEAATLVLDDGDEAWIQEYLAGDTGLHKSGNVEGVENKTATSSEGNVISWEPVKDAVAYKVFRSEKENGDYECIATVTETSYTDTDTNGKQYYYKTTAIKKNAVTTTKSSAKKDGTTTAAPGSITTTIKSDSTTLDPSENPSVHPTGEVKPSDVTKENESTTGKGGGDESTKPNEEKTTDPEEETTAKEIPSAPGYTPSQKDARNVRAVFEANARSATSAKALAQLCTNKLGTSTFAWGQTPATIPNGGIIALKSKSISGFTECYKFTKDPSATNGVKMIGYVFKVAEDVDPAEFVSRLRADAISSYRVSALRTMRISEVTTDYYDQYVLFVVTES